MVKLYLLDRNAVGTIKDSVRGVPDDPKARPERSRRLKVLRDIDKKSNVVSPVLSIWEGRTGREECQDEKQRTVDEEAAAVKQFYRRARTDAGVLTEKLPNTAEVLSGPAELRLAEYKKIVEKAQADLVDAKNERDARCWRDELLKEARILGVSTQHPVILFCLSALYGYDAARKVIKPKADPEKRHPYNALSDIVVLSRVIQIEQIAMYGADRRTVVKYVTFDKGLHFMFKHLRPRAAGIHNPSVPNIYGSLTLDSHTFPRLSDDELEELAAMLACGA